MRDWFYVTCGTLILVLGFLVLARESSEAPPDRFSAARPQTVVVFQFDVGLILLGALGGGGIAVAGTAYARRPR